MFRIILALLLMTTPAMAVTQFNASGAPNSVSENASLFPAEIYSQWGILQTLLQNYRQGYYLTYNNGTTLNIGSGEVSVWNGSASLFLQNSGTQTATTANLDTGASFSASTTYYVYAGTSSSTAATATITISLNNTTPTGVTYYKLLGNFTTDSGGNIAGIQNSSITSAGSSVTCSLNQAYLATSDTYIMGCGKGGLNPTANFSLVSDSSPSPSTTIASLNSTSTTTDTNSCISWLVKKGLYWKFIAGGTQSNPNYCNSEPYGL